YVVDSDLEKDEKDPKEDLAYYPTDRGNNDDDKSSNDDKDDDDVEKDEEDKEEDEHLALADHSNVSTDDLDIRCLEHTLLGQSTRRHMLDLYLYATSVNLTIVGRALMRASKTKTMQDAIEIATKLRNKKINTPVECQTKNKKRLDNTAKNNQNQQQPNKRSSTNANILTPKKAMELVRRLHAMNVGIKGTTREIVQSKRTKTMKTKSKVLRHVEWCMPLEEEKPNKTLTTLRMRLKLKRDSYLA
nr:hypothetical protein [Tanacetum cinerariifolium]